MHSLIARLYADLAALLALFLLVAGVPLVFYTVLVDADWIAAIGAAIGAFAAVISLFGLVSLSVENDRQLVRIAEALERMDAAPGGRVELRFAGDKEAGLRAR